jgi:hypothetical protein
MWILGCLGIVQFRLRGEKFSLCSHGRVLLYQRSNTVAAFLRERAFCLRRRLGWTIGNDVKDLL